MNRDSTTKRLPRRLGWPGCALLAVLPILIAAVVMMFWARGIRRDVQAKLAQLRTAAEPVTTDELAEMYRMPPRAEDNTRFWLAAIEPLGSDTFILAAGNLPLVGSSRSEIPLPGQAWPELDDARRFLSQWGNPLDQLHLAGEIDGETRYPLDFNGASINLPDHLTGVHKAAQLLALEAYVKSHDGDTAGVAEALHTGFAVSRTLEDDPILTSLLVRLGGDGFTRETLQRLISSIEFSDDDLARLRTDLQGARYHTGLQRAMLGERAIGLKQIQHPSEQLQVGSFAATDVQCFLECMEAVVANVRLPLGQAFAESRQLDLDLAAITGDGSGLSGLRNPATRALIPSVRPTVFSVVHGTAQIETADVALAVEQFQRHYNELPRRLDQLVPEFLPSVPRDVFDGRPLRYIVVPEGYVVYSVGQDLIDEDGLEGGSRPNDRGDITFAVKRERGSVAE